MKVRDEHPGIGWGTIILLSAALSIARGFTVFLDDDTIPELSVDWSQHFMMEIMPSFLYGTVFLAVFLLGAQLFTKRRIPKMSNFRLASYVSIYCVTSSVSLSMILAAIVGIPSLEVPTVAILSIVDLYPLFLMAFALFAVIALTFRFSIPQQGDRDHTDDSGP